MVADTNTDSPAQTAQIARGVARGVGLLPEDPLSYPVADDLHEGGARCLFESPEREKMLFAQQTKFVAVAFLSRTSG
jgi:hypothetical protein